MALDLNELETFQDHISQKPIQDSPKKQKIELTPRFLSLFLKKFFYFLFV